MSTSCSPSKEKYCSLISDIIDKSKDIIVETEDVLDYDAVELTLLLKSIGFQLSSLDFDCSPNEDVKDIEIEIKCKQSGIHSKLMMKSTKCTCPSRKSVNNNSFWEVQGIAPSTPVAKTKGIVQDTSCNLLPEVSKRTTNLAKTMLTVLLQHYQVDFEATMSMAAKMNTIGVKQLVERLQGKEGEKITNLSIGNEQVTELCLQKTVVANFVSPTDKCNGEINTHCSTPLSSINITPVPSYDNPMMMHVPKIVLNNINDNTQDSLIENEKPPVGCSDDPSPKNEGLATTPTESEQTFDKINPDTERDVCLIQAITDARRSLDNALLMLKCNITRTLSQTSMLTVTPQSPTCFKKPSSPKRDNANRRLSADNIDINRRHSTGARLEGKTSITPNKGLKSASSSSAVNEIKKKPLGLPSRLKTSKPDTPRPVTKKSLEKAPVASKIATRTPSGSSLKSGLSMPKTQLLKNPKLSLASSYKKS